MLTGKTEWTISNEQQVNRLTHLINKLISLARMEEQQQINLTVINASSILEKTAKSFKAVVVQANKQLKLDIVSGVRIKAEESGF